MAKTVVKKNDTVLPDETLDRVLNAIEGMKTDLAAELGTDKDEKGVEFAKDSLTCDPIRKKRLKANVAWLLSAFMSERTGNVGREAKVDIDQLQLVYLVAKRDWPNAKVGTLRNIVVSTYNMKYASSPEFMIDAAYVAKHAKDRGWDSLPVPGADAKLPAANQTSETPATE